MPLAVRLRDYDIGVKHLSFSACPPSYRKHDDASGCSSWTDAVIDSIIDNNDIDAVICILSDP